MSTVEKQMYKLVREDQLKVGTKNVEEWVSYTKVLGDILNKEMIKFEPLKFQQCNWPTVSFKRYILSKSKAKEYLGEGGLLINWAQSERLQQQLSKILRLRKKKKTLQSRRGS